MFLWRGNKIANKIAVFLRERIKITCLPSMKLFFMVNE